MFHDRHDEKVLLVNNKRTATSKNGDLSSVTSANRLITGESFDVEIKATTNGVARRFTMGVTKVDPFDNKETPKLISNMADVWVVAGFFLQKGKTRRSGWGGDLRVLPGDKMGIRWHEEGDVYIIVNGIETHVFADVSGPVWGIFEMGPVSEIAVVTPGGGLDDNRQELDIVQASPHHQDSDEYESIFRSRATPPGLLQRDWCDDIKSELNSIPTSPDDSDSDDMQPSQPVYENILDLRENAISGRQKFNEYHGSGVRLRNNRTTAERTGDGNNIVLSAERLCAGQWFVVETNQRHESCRLNIGLTTVDPVKRPKLPKYAVNMTGSWIIDENLKYRHGMKIGVLEYGIWSSHGDKIGIKWDNGDVCICKNDQHERAFYNVPGPVWAVFELSDVAQISVSEHKPLDSPRLCHLQKRYKGQTYGFTLQPTKDVAGSICTDIECNSPAAASGLREGDRVIQVNGVSIDGYSFKYVLGCIASNPTEVKLFVVDRYTYRCLQGCEVTVAGDIKEDQPTYTCDRLSGIETRAMARGSDLASRRKNATGTIPCPFWSICDYFIGSLDLPGIYFNTEFDLCYCRDCLDSRGDKIHYTRGEPPKLYSLPVGWSRFGLRVPVQAHAMSTFDRWHVAYHGTNPNKIRAILNSQHLLMPGDFNIDGEQLAPKPGHFTDDRRPPGFDIKQIFVSPTIAYAGHKVYAKPERWIHPNSRKTYNMQVAIQIRIKPGAYEIGKETIGLERKKIDPGFDNDELEWSTKHRGATILVGILVKPLAIYIYARF